MKKRLLIFSIFWCLLTLGIGIARASINLASASQITLASGTSINTGTLASWSTLGMNYGHADGTVSDFNAAQTTTDANNLYNAGFRNIRLAFPLYSDTSSTGGYTYEMYQAKLFKAAHSDFHIICGVSMTGLTSSNEAAWISGTVADASATTTVQNDCDEYWVGNELEDNHNGTLTDAQVRTAIQTTIAGGVKSGGYTGTVGYDEVGIANGISMWTSSSNIGSLDKLCFNVYNGSTTNLNDVNNFIATLNTILPTFPNACIGEFNVTGDSAVWSTFLSQFKTTDFANSIAKMIQVLREDNLTGYFFDYQSDGNYGIPSDYWAAKLQNGTCTATYYVLTRVFGNPNATC